MIFIFLFSVVPKVRKKRTQKHNLNACRQGVDTHTYICSEWVKQIMHWINLICYGIWNYIKNKDDDDIYRDKWIDSLLTALYSPIAVGGTTCNGVNTSSSDCRTYNITRSFNGGVIRERLMIGCPYSFIVVCSKLCCSIMRSFFSGLRKERRMEMTFKLESNVQWAHILFSCLALWCSITEKFVYFHYSLWHIGWKMVVEFECRRRWFLCSVDDVRWFVGAIDAIRIVAVETLQIHARQFIGIFGWCE